jgi:hypothetical protein
METMRDAVDHGPEAQGDDARYAAELLERLSHSKFRASFSLGVADRAYAWSKGMPVVARHARELLRARVGAARPLKDGKQTPYRGHPVFVAQHATATCCRSCIARWHGIPAGVPLSDRQIERLATLVTAWIQRDLDAHPRPATGTAPLPSRSRTRGSGRGRAGASVQPTLF